jgi:3-phenylpropionate/trans-cinnamate dioxygenase ferredoxin subunit
MGEWEAIGLAEEDLPPGSLRAAAVEGREVAIARLADGTLAAFDEWCTHEECPLSDGELEGERIVCTCHGSEFDVRTGTVLQGPATEPLPVYEIRAVDGELRVRVG